MPYSAFPPSLPNPLQPLPAAQKVLVVDDVPDNAAVIGHVIKDLCDLLVAHTGEEALALARQHQPDLILLDIRMPQMDGFEVCRRLKTDLETAHIPVIFLTALTEPHCEELGLNLGAVDFVTKPFRSPVLKARVRTHLQIAQQRQMLQLLSHSDGLTGVANRRFFGAQLAREFLRLQRLGEPLSLVMIDVDHFKAYNDHYGHLVGDDCLGQLAHAIQGALHRPGDLLARYGGEEFVCLLPHTALDGAVLVAQGIVDALRALDLPHAASPLGAALTVSMGIASIVPSPSNSAQQLLADADRRLYLAKGAGRDRIAWSD
ncbi:Bacteriophytochrome cph2 [Delftia tsuruhatensis]|uniref:diguanylate cyclase n=1 Tax=Delftia tsuruhatensis TaxID=180282 RepID=UPI001E742AA1|nr:diguanylate cyclase [Delftia tsuruhatensis]CAB5718453.1 Bacteriophytochrome cph2 [Delftia tsuruhatensis]CAC9692493.1 Bacteriophytochrome cph2 [Delftia tsuruhatensis]